MRSIVRASALLVFVLLFLAWPEAGLLAAGERFLVLPFDNPEQNAKLYWLSEASSVLVSDNLNALARRAYTREERLEAFEQLQVPVAAQLSHATVIRLGQLIGATHVVIGSLRLGGDQIAVRAQNIRLDTGRLESEVEEFGAPENLFAIFDRVGRRLAGMPAVGVELSPRPALPVFENYIKGLMAVALPAQVGYLNAAIKLDPTFDRARVALWAVHQDAGNPQAALVAAAAVPQTSPLYPSARFNVALSLIQLTRLEDAFATLKTLGEKTPRATIMNNIGVIQMRRAATPQGGKASYYFNQAIKLDETDPDYCFNLGYAYWAEKDQQAAIFWLREAVRRNSADGEAHAVLSVALQAAGATTEATRERELATQLSSSYAEWAMKPVAGELIPRGLERLKESLEESTAQRVDTQIATGGQREQRELATFHMDRGRRFFEQGSDAEAVAEFRRALYLSPYEAEAQLLLGRIYLRTGHTPAAIDAFKISIWSHESAAARIGLAKAYLQARNEASARSEIARALVLEPQSSEAKELLGQLKP
ncbi:MAG: tetratricopeptide repeat protein [Vicinamibacterales bacterium]|nr:tetratricopeptide repeat protein [Vicinamibacterales bacterium]